jgi:hypothetical protein
VKGLVSRGGFVFDMAWSDGRLTDVTVTATTSNHLALAIPADAPQTDHPCTCDGSVLHADLSAGEQLHLRYTH